MLFFFKHLKQVLNKNCIANSKILILLLSLSISCITKVKEEVKGVPILIDFEDFKQTDSLISPRDLFSEVDYVLLKTPDSLRVTLASKIKEFGDTLLLLDEKKRILFSFDSDGEFLGLVGRKGEGPSEFREVSDFDIFNNQIFIYSRADFSVFVFDSSFKFIKRFKFDTWGSQISLLKSGNVALYSYLADVDDNYNIHIYDQSGILKEKRMPFDKDGVYVAMNYSGFINGPFYSYPLSSIIYKISEGSSYDSIKYEVNFPNRFKEGNIFNNDLLVQEEFNKGNENILTNFEFGKNGEFICYYHFREGSSNGYTLGVRLSSGEKFGHLNMLHAAKGLNDLLVRMFFIGPYNMPTYSEDSGYFLIASNIESVGLYYDYLINMINSLSITDHKLLEILSNTDLEETVIMKFKLKDRL